LRLFCLAKGHITNRWTGATEASFASSVIRLSSSAAPWPGQLNRYVAPQSMNRLHITVGLILVSVATVNCARQALTGEQIEQVMLNEVPIGSDVSRAIAFFDSRHIDHTGIVQLDNESRSRPDTLFSNAKLDPVRDRIRSHVGGIMRGVGGDGFLARWDIIIRFYLDGNGKVVAHQAKKVGTSF